MNGWAFLIVFVVCITVIGIVQRLIDAGVLK